jgi:hypothetical protein
MATDNQNTSSIEINLQDVLSLIGIDLPQIPVTGSDGTYSELPNVIELKEIKGVVVNKTTNEPLPGVLVTNKLLRRSITNNKGEFVIRHPDIENTNLNPANFSLYFKLKKYSFLSIIPYNSDKSIKSNLGIVTLNPLESYLKNEISKYLEFPDPVVEEYTTKDVNLEFKIQEGLNLNIDTLKGTVIPGIIILLVSTYGISNITDIIEKYKNNPQAALDEIKDLITCPSEDKVSSLISTKNNLVKKINNTLNIINSLTTTLNNSQNIINTTNTLYQTLKNIPTPSAIGGVGVPISVINGIQDTKTFLSNSINILKTNNSNTLSILRLLQETLSQVLILLQILDKLIQYCYPDQSQEQISIKLTELTTQQSYQTSPVITDVNGFTMGVETEITDKPLKRRRATATNKQGVVMLRGEWSFSSIDQILIDELIFYIQQNNLKAD